MCKHLYVHNSQELIFQSFSCDPEVEHRHTSRLGEVDILAALTFHYNNSNSSRCCRSSAVIMKLNRDTLLEEVSQDFRNPDLSMGTTTACS